MERGAGAASYEQRRVGCFDFTSVSDCSNRCCLFVGHLLKKHLSFSTKIMMETGLLHFVSLAFSTSCCCCCCFLKIVHNALNAKRCLDGARPLASQSQTVACLSPVVSLGSPLSHLYHPAPPWHCLLAVSVVLLIKITDIDTFRCAVARTQARTDKVNTDTLVSFTGTVVRVAAVDGILRCYISS